MGAARMGFHLLLIVLMSELLARVGSARVQRAIAVEAQFSGSSDLAVIDDNTFLSCAIGKSMDKIIIHVDDRPLWEYFYTKEDYYSTYGNGTTLSIDCKPYTAPNPSAVLRN